MALSSLEPRSATAPGVGCASPLCPGRRALHGRGPAGGKGPENHLPGCSIPPDAPSSHCAPCTHSPHAPPTPAASFPTLSFGSPASPRAFRFPLQIPKCCRVLASPGQADLGSGAFPWTGHLGPCGAGMVETRDSERVPQACSSRGWRASP